MALTAEQINKVSRILGVHKTFINAQITSLGADFTAQDELDIADELDRWDTAGFDFTRIQPKEKNFGAEINPNDVKNDIRKNLSTLLAIPSYAAYSGIGTLQIGL